MTIGRGVWLRAAAFAAAIGLAWIGVGFLAYALYVALIPSLGFAGASAFTAATCLVIGALTVAVLVMRAPLPAPAATAVPVEADVVESNAMIKALSELAEDHPIMAVCAAAILGATNAHTTARRR